ncbi:SEC-C metal-binding domain-containing protein [Patescibacteria group bacterium]
MHFSDSTSCVDIIYTKEGVKIQRESQTLATVTFQNYFRMYNKLSGMTGTAVTEAEEFAKIYKLDTMVIPTHKPMIRKDLNDLIYKIEDGKHKAVIEDVKERQKKGQPILIGTISIEKNEQLALEMQRQGLNPQVLNAKHHEKEARIIAEAGRVGAITIATNMAGRGVDIILGGTEPACTKNPDGTPVQDDPNFQTWKKWKEEHDKIIELGGLHVIGTERHEARRIDNQLRGRAGRQGDPGSSQFYVSTEDDLMRIFGGDRMKSLMSTLRVPEDMPIENKMISKTIESAQRKVEGNNFDIRKHLVEYDDVINKHREVIYKKRRDILETYEQQKSEQSVEKDLSETILEKVEDEIEQVVSFHTAAEQIKDWNLEEIYQVVTTIFPVTEKLKDDINSFAQEDNKLDKVKASTAIIEHLVKLAKEKYDDIKKKMEENEFNWIDIEKAVLIRSIDTLWVEHLEAMSSVRQGIGLRGYGQRDPLVEYKKEAYRLYNELNSFIQKEVVYSIYKIDMMYGREAQGFEAPSLVDRAKQFSAPSKTMDKGSSSFSGYQAPSSGVSKSDKNKEQTDTVKQKVKDAEGNKVGRNDPCPCGSGKKFKKCHGK